MFESNQYQKIRKDKDIWINPKEKLGSGTFGTVYKGRD